MEVLSVLLVDDEQFVRMGLRSLIDWGSCGYQIIGEADNGEDALRMIAEKQPDLVITDIRMPVLDGLELIRRITQTGHLTTKFIIISGYDEFKYAQQAMRYGVSDFILKPVDQDELQAILMRLKRQIAKDQVILKKTDVIWINSIFEALLRGETDQKNIEEWEQAVGIQKAKKLFYVFVELNDDGLVSGNSSQVISDWELCQQLGCIVAKNLELKEPVFLYQHDRNLYGMIVTDRILSSFGSAENLAVTLQRRLSRAIGKTVMIYVGAPVQHVDQLYTAYSTAREAMQYKFAQPEGAIVYEKVQSQPLQYMELEPGLRQQLMESIEEKDAARIEEAVERIFNAFREHRVAPEVVKTTINHCVFSVVRFIKELGGREEELKFLQFMVSCQDLNVAPATLKRYFRDFLLESAGRIAELTAERNRGIVHRIKCYIDSHFCEDISLKSLGAIFYMNPTYLGQLFKKTYGVYFREYLMNLRINEAKRLLRQTDLCVYEIADRVGFSNPEYFVTQFEKIVEMTPAEYRNQWIKFGEGDKQHK